MAKKKTHSDIHEIQALKSQLNKEGNSYTSSSSAEEKETLDQIQYSLRKYQAMKEMDDSFWELNLKENKIRFSSNYYSLLGYSEDDFPGDIARWATVIHPEDYKKMEEVIGGVLAKKSTKIALEFRIKKSDGDYVWLLSRGVVTKYTQKNNPEIITGNLANITHIKEAELNIEKSNLRLSTTIANLNEGILLEDENRKIVLTNDFFCKLFEIPADPNQMVGADCTDAAEQSKHLFDDPEGFTHRVNELIKTRQQALGDKLLMKNGTILKRDFLPIFVGKEYFGHLWKYTNITQTERTQNLLKHNEEKYRGIIENMNLGMVEVDPNERVLYVNQTFCDITGYGQQELIGSKISQIIVNKETEELISEKRALRSKGISDMYELMIKNKRGEVRWLLISAAPRYDDQKKLIGSIGIHLDITEQKQLEQELMDAKSAAEESSKAKESFLANMSHEIRTPMNAILGMSDLLEKTKLNKQQNSYLRAIHTSAENLLIIINDILDLTKIEAGKIKIEDIDFDFKAFISQLEKMFYYKAEEKGLDLRFRIDKAVPDYLKGDPYRLNQVLVNLIGNAMKFTDEGRITLKAKLIDQNKHYSTLRFEVIDTGVGMSQEYLDKIFYEFSQEDSSVTRKFGGTGLGLTITKKIIELMNGEIEVKSKKQEGTNVSFSMVFMNGKKPKEEELENLASATFSNTTLEGVKVLLVEDNEFNRLLAVTMLKNFGAQIDEAENGLNALQMIRQNTYDVVLMDIQMPVLNGYEATELVRNELHRHLPIIALTANAIKGEREKCLEKGMDDYLAKPFSEHELIECIKKQLDMHANPMDTPKIATEDKAEKYSLEMLEKTAKGDIEFIKHMLKTLLDQLPESLDKMKEAIKSQDLKTLKALAHKIKPGLMNLKVDGFELIREIELWPENEADWKIIDQKFELANSKIQFVIDDITTRYLDD